MRRPLPLSCLVAAVVVIVVALAPSALAASPPPKHAVAVGSGGAVASESEYATRAGFSRERSGASAPASSIRRTR